MGEVWTVSLFAGLRLCRSGQVLTRFRTQKTAALLARLVYPPLRPHMREELAEWLWPEAAAEDGRRSLRVALSSLRRQLEPPSVPPGGILSADHFQVGINPLAVTTDVGAWEACLRAAARAPAERRTCLAEAVTHYGGPLLPGFYDEWVLTERERLAEAYIAALLELAGGEDMPLALDYALRAVTADPLREEAHGRVIQLHLAAGRAAEAHHQFAECERLLMAEMDTKPSPALRALLESGGRSLGKPAPRFGLRPSSLPLMTATSPVTRAAPTETPDSLVPLPPTFTRFVGRRKEIDEVRTLLADPTTRLLTVTGPGGVGKTRLGLEAARLCTASGGRTAVFVPLADITDLRLLPTALLTALGLAAESGHDPWEQICYRLRQRPTLLVLDNLEQMPAQGADLVQQLLTRVPTLLCLATSRRRLDLEAEREYPLSPLPVPEGGTPVSLLSSNDSIALFVDRAQSARLDFQLTITNAPAVAEIVRRLEGIPLAIELAAARARSLAPRQMVAELEQRFTFLVSRRRSVTERHISLWAAIDWSYRLLSPEMQHFFRGLSVFRGGWTAEAAQAVCGEPKALLFLEQLQDCSLVESVEAAETMRFRILEALREFGRERLAPGEAAVLKQRHADWCLHLAEQAEPKINGLDSGAWLDRLLSEHDNMRAALEWSAQAGAEEAARSEVGLCLAGALASFWLKRDAVPEGRRILEDALDRSEEAPQDVRAKLLFGSARLISFQNELPLARKRFEQSLALWREMGDTPRIAQASLSLGHLMESQDGAEAARPFYAESLRLCRSQGSLAEIAGTLASVGSAALSRGDIREARPLLEECLTLRRSQGHLLATSHALSHLSSLALRQGEYRQARVLLEEGLTLLHAAHQPTDMAGCLSLLGELAYLQGDLTAAEALYQECLSIFHGRHYQVGIACAQEALGEIAATRGAWAQARAFFEGSLTSWQDLGNSCGVCRVLGARLGGLALEQEDHAEARRLRERSLGMVRRSGNSMDLAIATCDLAEAAAAAGDVSQSRALRAESAAVVRHWSPSANLAALQDSQGRIALEEGNAPEARALHEQSLTLHRACGLKPETAQSLALLAAAAFRQGDLAPSARGFRESLFLCREMEDPLRLASVLEGLAAVLAAQGQTQTAALLFGAVDAGRGRAGMVLSPRGQSRRQGLIAPARHALGTAALEAKGKEGKALPLDRVVSLALAEKGS